MKKIIILFVVGFLFHGGNSLFAQDDFAAEEDYTSIVFGIIYPFNGNINIEYKEDFVDDINCRNCDSFLIDESDTYSISSGVPGFKIGYNFFDDDDSSIGLSLNSLNFKSDGGDVSNVFLGIDMKTSRLLFSAGVGSGSLKSKDNYGDPVLDKSGSGFLISLNLGYGFTLFNSLRLSVKYLYTSFSYSLNVGRVIDLHEYGYSSKRTDLRKEVSFSGFTVDLVYGF